MNKRRKKKDDFDVKGLSGFVESMVAVTVGMAAVSTMLDVINKSAEEEIMLRLEEFKRMGATEYILKERKKEYTIYDEIDGLKEKLERYCKRNKQYELSTDSCGRYVVAWKRKEKPKRWLVDGRCKYCGHLEGDYD